MGNKMKVISHITSILMLGFSLCLYATEMASFNYQPKSENGFNIISSKHINRIVTPFHQPSLKIDALPDVQYKTVENVIYLAVPDAMRGRNIAGFITEKGDESLAIGFVFRAEPVAPKEIHLRSAEPFGHHKMPNKLAKRFETSHPRQRVIVLALQQLAFQQLPEGYSVIPPAAEYLPTCQQSGLTFDFYHGQLVMGSNYMIAIGTVKNVSEQRIEFIEHHCYESNVVAVAAYPKTTLLSGEFAEVFVMFYRNIVEQNKQNRRSLLTG